MSGELRVFLAGDVMTGRGIDQALAQPSDPVLYEEWVHDAREYLRLAERVNGLIARPLAPAQVWGDALIELERLAPDLRIVNLETAITTANAAWPRRGIHYRMHPGNVDILRVPKIDACVLANNHVLDWGHEGLAQTLHTLHGAGIGSVGAGADDEAAWAPTRLSCGGSASVLLFALAFETSGVPVAWAATARRSGVAWLAEPTPAAADEWLVRIAAQRRAGDCVIASVHWGGNWVHAIAAAQRAFAHRLIDSGIVDVVYGHSSHHPLPPVVYRERLVLYGCGDLLNDDEGIGGTHGGLRSDLGCLYLATLAPDTGQLRELEVVPLRLRGFRLQNADVAERRDLLALFNDQHPTLGSRVEAAVDGRWHLRWATPAQPATS
jgi:poly-gamma-glutamate capsule biosynthesis protein CapA/YwtB (metallophosphatase superfamily)